MNNLFILFSNMPGVKLVNGDSWMKDRGYHVFIVNVEKDGLLEIVITNDCKKLYWFRFLDKYSNPTLFSSLYDGLYSDDPNFLEKNFEYFTKAQQKYLAFNIDAIHDLEVQL